MVNPFKEFIKTLEFPFCYYAYLIDHEGLIDYFHYGLWEPETKEIKEAQENLARLMKSLIPKGVERILDVGCGLGKTTHELISAGYDAVGISPDIRLIEMAKTKFSEDRPKLIVSSFEDYRAADTFDLILFQESSQYITDLNFLFARCNKLLNERGYILICDEIRYTPHGPLHEKKNIENTAREYGFTIMHNENITKKILKTSSLASEIIVKNRDSIISEFLPFRENARQEVELLLEGWQTRTTMFEKNLFGYEIFLFSKNRNVLRKFIDKLRFMNRI